MFRMILSREKLWNGIILDCWKGLNENYNGQNRFNGQELDNLKKITRVKSSTFLYVECDMKDLMIFNQRAITLGKLISRVTR
jgi:hypothetical protein